MKVRVWGVGKTSPIQESPEDVLYQTGPGKKRGMDEEKATAKGPEKSNLLPGGVKKKNLDTKITGGGKFKGKIIVRKTQKKNWEKKGKKKGSGEPQKTGKLTRRGEMDLIPQVDYAGGGAPGREGKKYVMEGEGTRQKQSKSKNLLMILTSSKKGDGSNHRGGKEGERSLWGGVE